MKLYKRLLLRFIRGFLAGAFGSLASMLPFIGNGWQELETWLIALSIAGIAGGLSGGILTLDKYFRDRKIK